MSATHSEAALGTTLLLASLPRLALMLVGGVAADRIHPKLLLGLSLAARAVILGVFASWMGIGIHVDAVDFYLVAVLFGTVDAFYWPTQGALVPRVVSPDRLPQANSLIQTAQQLATILGPLVAGVLLREPSRLVFYAVACLYVVAVIAVMGLRVPRWTDRQETAHPKSAWADLVKGLRYVQSVRVMLVIMGIAMVMSFLFLGPINVGLPIFVNHQGWSGSVYGYFESALGVGAVVGGLLSLALKGL